MLCPYCDLRPCDSNDHVFPQFLGGRTAVAVCTNCNSTFGHTFEGATAKHFRNWMFLLRRCGMRTPTPIVWKEIAKDESGRLYDVDQDFKASLSKPEITRSESGRIQRVTWNQDRLRPIARSLESRGHELRFETGESVSIDVRQHQLMQPIDGDIKRLCIKMSIAVWKRLGLVPQLENAVRSYLVDAAVSAVCPVRLALDRYDTLDVARPPAGHLVYCRMSAAERRFYSVVQFFGVMQFYCELASDIVADDCAVLAVHDPITHEESFQFVSSMDYPLPPRFVDSSVYTDGWRERLERFRLELVSLYGDQAPLALSVNQTTA